MSHPYTVTPRVIDEDSTPLIIKAALHGHLDTVERMLDLGVSPNTVDRAGMTPLHAACMHGHLKIVTFLIEEANAMVNKLTTQALILLHSPRCPPYHSLFPCSAPSFPA